MRGNDIISTALVNAGSSKYGPLFEFNNYHFIFLVPVKTPFYAS